MAFVAEFISYDNSWMDIIISELNTIHILYV